MSEFLNPFNKTALPQSRQPGFCLFCLILLHCLKCRFILFHLTGRFSHVNTFLYFMFWQQNMSIIIYPQTQKSFKWYLLLSSLFLGRGDSVCHCYSNKLDPPLFFARVTATKCAFLPQFVLMYGFLTSVSSPFQEFEILVLDNFEQPIMVSFRLIYFDVL